MKTYTITITEEHLKLLSEITDKMARVIVGQLDYGIGDEVDTALLKHIANGKPDDRYYELRRTLRTMLDSIHTIAWDQSPHTRYGVNYSKKSDILWDMYEVFRHQLWEDDEDRSEYTVDASKPHHWYKEVPLIKIERNK